MQAGRKPRLCTGQEKLTSDASPLGERLVAHPEKTMSEIFSLIGADRISQSPSLPPVTE